MSSVNKVIILGRLGRDPEVRYAPNGDAVCNISLATSTFRKDKNTGERVEDTQWHRVTFYGRQAEVAGEYLKKGSLAYVEGRLKYGKYIDKATGIEKPTCDIIANELKLMGDPAQRQGYPSQGQQNTAPQGARPPAAAPRQAPPAGGSGFDDMDDDIPF